MKRLKLCSSIIVFMLISSLAAADDTDIFGGGEINVPPNVLIIFDNSGSMDGTIQEYSLGDYDPSVTYSGPYRSDYTFIKSGRNWYYFIYIGSDGIVDSGEIPCTDTRESLNQYGHWQGRINQDGQCINRGQAYRVRTGNYWNYLEANTVTSRKKIDVAKEVVNDLFMTTSGVRFGIMIFNTDEGGRVVAPIKSRTAAEVSELTSVINALTPSTWTPLAETLAEAGLYFAGADSWFNSSSSVAGVMDVGRNYKSPIEWRCQQNYVIIMTDGASTKDRNSILTSTYLNGKKIGDYDGDGKDNTFDSSDGSDYLDDVAKFLYENDLLESGTDKVGESFEDDSFPTQNIITYTIGFDIANTLLSETADSSHGQGDYYTTQDNISLAEIFRTIIADIISSSSEFVAPVVPVNRTNKTYADNAMYVCVFMPGNEGEWAGNIKKFGLTPDGVIVDRDGNPATIPEGEPNAGAIKDGAHSCWYEVVGPEGMTVDKGGAGQVLLSQASRTFYTRRTGSVMLSIDKTSSSVTPTELGLTSETEKADLIDYLKGQGNYAPDATGAGTLPRTWLLGDIIHSRPAILHDANYNDRNIIFVGSNDGFLHCFVDNDNATSDILTDDTLTEAWAFTPWDLVPNLKNIPSVSATAEIAGDNNHDYFVDGVPVVYEPAVNKHHVIFGLRRGGEKYYALDVSTYTSPTFLWEVSNTILGATAPLGQSWAEPVYTKIKRSSGDTDGAKVILLTGGYDPNQDNLDPGVADSKGRAFFAIDAETGALSSQLNFNNSNYAKMKYSIVDFASYDHHIDAAGFMDDVVYAPDLGGNLFVFADRDGDGVWDKRHLFNAGNDGGTTGLRKFFKAPAVMQFPSGTGDADYVFIGSGDREHPNNTTIQNRFYGIVNSWPHEWWLDNQDALEATTAASSDLINVSTDLFNDPMATQAQKDLLLQSIENGAGWWFDLPNAGEKCVSSPLVFENIVYFTTFTPSSTTAVLTDMCATGGGAGIARLYAVNYKTGSAVLDLDEVPGNDRSVIIGTGIPSDPIAVATENKMILMIAAERKVATKDLNEQRTFTPFYWWQSN